MLSGYADLFWGNNRLGLILTFDDVYYRNFICTCILKKERKGKREREGERGKGREREREM